MFHALWAQGAAAPTTGDALTQMAMMAVLLFLGMYFLVLRPGNRERQQREVMLKNLKKNDRIMTSGGIFGVVTQVQHDTREVTIRVDESNNTRLRITLGAVSRVLGSDTEAKESTGN